MTPSTPKGGSNKKSKKRSTTEAARERAKKRRRREKAQRAAQVSSPVTAPEAHAAPVPKSKRSRGRRRGAFKGGDQNVGDVTAVVAQNPTVTPPSNGATTTASVEKTVAVRGDKHEGDKRREGKKDGVGREVVELEELHGVVSVNPRGFGFVSGDKGEAFIPPAMVGRIRLVAGDTLDAQVKTVDERMSVVKIGTVTRGRGRLFGVIERRGEEVWMRCDPWLSSVSWQVAGVSSSAGGIGMDDLKDGDAVSVKIIGRRVRVLAVHGPLSCNEALYARSLERARVAERLAAGAGAKPKSTGSRGEGRSVKRRDLTGLLTFTIDGPESRDLDDALSVRVEEDGSIILFVHIADVAQAVTPGSADDLRARHLGTSVYLPGRVVPMLSEGLSFDACSLLEGMERATMTVEMRVDPSGRVTSSQIYPSTICSNARLTYTDVAAVLTARSPERTMGSDLVRAIEVAHVVATRIGAARATRGGLRSQRSEGLRLVPTDTGFATTGPDGADIAHDLIEETMVAANETVALWLVERGLSGVFRTHEAPGPEAAAALETFAYGLGVVAILGEKVTPRALSALERQLAERGYAQADIWEVLMGQLGRAEYRSEVGSHFGLASEAYVHFTSPIRRYADLTVHRIVKAVLAHDDVPTGVELAELCAELNLSVEAASKAERVATTLLWLSWMAEHQPVGTKTKGRIIRLSKRGALVHLDGTGVSGWVSAPGGGPVEIEGNGLVLHRGPLTWRLGWILDVEVSGLDLEAGNVELELLNKVSKAGA
jgi:ribonuclease R